MWSFTFTHTAAAAAAAAAADDDDDDDDVAMVVCDVELSESVKQQYMDNIDWIKHAHQHNLVSITVCLFSVVCTY